MHLMWCTSSDRYLTQINELLMSLKSHSRKLTLIIQNEMLNQKRLSCSVAGNCFAQFKNEMINVHSKPNYIHDNAGEYETFSFWILNFDQCYLLDKCGI